MQTQIAARQYGARAAHTSFRWTDKALGTLITDLDDDAVQPARFGGSDPSA